VFRKLGCVNPRDLAEMLSKINLQESARSAGMCAICGKFFKINLREFARSAGNMFRKLGCVNPRDLREMYFEN
jgi:hypothetical protein